MLMLNVAGILPGKSQALGLDGYFPGSGVVIATVTATILLTTHLHPGYVGYRGDFADRVESLSYSQVKSEVQGVLRAMFPT